MDSMGGGNVSKDDFEVLILGRPGVAESDGSAGVNQAQIEGQERGDAPEMNGPMSPGQVETWAETSDGSDEFDAHSVISQRLKAFKARERMDRVRNPTKYGYCLRVLVEPEGYILADEVSGAWADPDDISADQRAVHGVGDDQIMTSRSQAGLHRTPLTLPSQWRYRTVICDSYHTGAQMANHLFTKDTYVVGTVRRDVESSLPTLRHTIPSRCKRVRRLHREGNVRRPIQSFRNPFLKQNVPRGYSTRYYDGPLSVVMWKDIRTRILLTTATSIGATDVQVTRRSKGRGVIRRQVQCPVMADLYNCHYKAVDKADQLRSSYEFGCPPKKWHRQLFWYVLKKAVAA
ncbi:hypothetical protein Bbelb_280620 [Branchiostoma belcheri]|nr:hypothetical protein Bbelb_280620 [Branchiostoma belcheri]